MKPFDLEAFKNGAVAITRCGYEAIFIAHRPEFTVDNQLLVSISDREGRQYLIQYSISGEYIQELESSKDLVGMKPTKKTYWTNIYKSSYKSPIGDGGFFLSEQRAKEKIKFPDQYIGTYPVEIEE